MSVRIRLTRLGDKKSPFYRIVVADSRNARDGKVIDTLGTYNPLKSPAEIKLDGEKAKAWLVKGAQPTETTRSILQTTGILEANKNTAPKTNDKKKKKK